MKLGEATDLEVELAGSEDQVRIVAGFDRCSAATQGSVPGLRSRPLFVAPSDRGAYAKTSAARQQSRVWSPAAGLFVELANGEAVEPRGEPRSRRRLELAMHLTAERTECGPLPGERPSAGQVAGGQDVVVIHPDEEFASRFADAPQPRGYQADRGLSHDPAARVPGGEGRVDGRLGQVVHDDQLPLFLRQGLRAQSAEDSRKVVGTRVVCAEHDGDRHGFAGGVIG